MFTIILSLGLLTMTGIAFAYAYHRSGELAFLSIVAATVLSFGMFKGGIFGPISLFASIITSAWFLYVLFNCRIKTVRIATAVGISATVAIALIRYILFPGVVIIGLGAAMIVPAALLYTFKCVVPEQKRKEEKIWGDYYERDVAQNP